MRLTKKELMSVINHPMCFGSRLVGKKMFAQIIKELCEYKDIEDELGIDLITLFEALKNGFYGTMYGVSKEDANANNWEPMFYELKNIDIKKYNGKLSFIYYLGDLSYSNFLVYKFDDYGKTWSLTREELL